MPDREEVLRVALKRIAAYMTPDQLRKRSKNLYGLEAEEAIVMAYDNVLAEAKRTLKAVPARRRPTQQPQDELPRPVHPRHGRRPSRRAVERILPGDDE